MQTPSSLAGFIHSSRRFLQLVAIAAALIIPSGVAHASVVYNFLTNSTTPGAFSGIAIYIEVTDQAFSERQLNSVDDFVQIFGRVPFVYTPPDEVFETFSQFNVTIGDGPGFPLSGSFIAAGESDTLSMSGAGAAWSGGYSTDAPFAPCNITNTCKFTGSWEIVAIPEPASLALLGAGCVAAFAFGRRRRNLR